MLKKRKKIIAIISIILFVGFFGTSYINVYAENEEEPNVALENQIDELEIQSKSAILIEAKTGTVLYEKNPDEKLKPASVTKVMTLLIIFDTIAEGKMEFDDIVTVTKHAASMGGSQCFFEEGEQQTVSDMIKCIEISSGNDAAVAMAEHIAGSEAAFVQMMNDKASELGMVNTHFVNACGLDAEGHLTTARDIAIMSRELITKHPEIFEYSTIWMDSIVHKTARGESKFDLANTNKFLNEYSGANGLKTGFTNEAGYCMSASASRNNIQLISVIMKADTKEIRNSEAGKLLDYGFAKCKVYTDKYIMNNMPEIEISNGVKKHIRVRKINDYTLVLVNQSPKAVERIYEIKDNLNAPIKAGYEVGRVIYKIGDEIIGEEPIVSDENIAKIDYLYGIKYVKQLFLIGGN